MYRSHPHSAQSATAPRVPLAVFRSGTACHPKCSARLVCVLSWAFGITLYPRGVQHRTSPPPPPAIPCTHPSHDAAIPPGATSHRGLLPPHILVGPRLHSSAPLTRADPPPLLRRYDFPWQAMGDYKYVLYLPFIAALALGMDDADGYPNPSSRNPKPGTLNLET